MSYAVEVPDDAQYVRLIFAGETSPQDHEQGRAEAVRALTATGRHRLLIDAREIQAKMSVSGDFEFTADHQPSFPPAVRVAALRRQDPSESDRFRFIENVAINRGHDLRVFTEQAEAENWLLAR